MGAVRSCIGIVSQDATLDGKLIGRGNLDFHSQLYYIDRGVRRKILSDVLDIVDMRETEAFEDFMGEWRQRRKSW